MDDSRIKKFVKLYPWYAGLSGDLLFWIAIDTLFLTIVKGFTEVQIVSLTTISLFSCIILQFPFLLIIKKIGNYNSVWVSSAMMLLSSILLTFGRGFIFIAIGKIVYESSFIFHNMESVILKNNLEVIEKSDDFVKIKARQNTIYSVITMLISFVASILFNWFNYLPMILCMTFCLVVFIMSFYIKDYSGYNVVSNGENNFKHKIKFSKVILLILFCYGLFFGVLNSMQVDGKLFIQQELMLSFSVKNTVLLIGIMLAISRVIRVVSNLIFNKVYLKLKDKLCIILPVILSLGSLLVILGFCVDNYIYLKFVLLTIGYLMFLLIRDPFNIYMQNIILNFCDVNDRQVMLTLLSLFSTILRAILSFLITISLLNFSSLFIIIFLAILSLFEISICVILFVKINIKNKELSNDKTSI